MYAMYGGHRFDDNALSFSFTERAMLDPSGVPYAYVPQYRCRYHCAIDDSGNEATNQAALTTKLAALRAALRVPFQDFVIYDNAGVASYHALRNNETTGGVKVLSMPEFPDSAGAHYTTFVELEFTIGAEVVAPVTGGGNNQIIRWAESITFIGTGGPRWVSQTLIEGPPRCDYTAQQTSIQAIQEGQALGYTRCIDFPAPLFPIEYEHQERRVRRGQTAQKFVNGVESEFPSMWQYHFEFNGAQAYPGLKRPANG